ncbi:hypothetical protein YYE_04891 [Plasmodium vinckei vinckei]|uniref:Fam-a protein n=1 Tax=Plasmodium vinckei vinckei TaxID=54757 RepID=A0A081I9M2_PLAVN|nr:hypothetical protein YYE_04891 [Plasmodium vinckei vinckei]
MNKFYIQIVFFLLSIFVYVNNKAFATDPAPIKHTTKPKTYCSTLEEIYEKNKHLLCSNPEETTKAQELMTEAVKCLEKHATSKNDYTSYRTDPSLRISLYKKKHKDETDIEKICYTDYDPNKYDELINEIWDPKHESPFNNGSVKIVRVYDPSLVIIQQRYDKKILSRQKYFYALVKRAQISENKTIIVMTSANINDHNPSEDEYQNKIIENANLFKIDIDSEDDIRNGTLKKAFVNIAGYLIEKKNDKSEITYIESVSIIQILIT